MEIKENEGYVYLNIYTLHLQKIFIPKVYRTNDYYRIKTDKGIGYDLMLSTEYYKKHVNKNPRYIEVGLYTYLLKGDHRQAFLGLRAIYKEKVERIRKNFAHPINIERGHLELYKKLVVSLKKLYEPI